MHRSDLRLSSHGLLSSLVTSLLPKDASRVGLIQYGLIFTKHATTLLPTRPYSEILGIHPRTHTKAYRLGRHRSTCPLNPPPPPPHTRRWFDIHSYGGFKCIFGGQHRPSRLPPELVAVTVFMPLAAVSRAPGNVVCERIVHLQEAARRLSQPRGSPLTLCCPLR